MAENILIYPPVNTTILTIPQCALKCVGFFRATNKAPPRSVKVTIFILAAFFGFFVKLTILKEQRG